MADFKRLTPEDYFSYLIFPPAGYEGQITWYAEPIQSVYNEGPWRVLAFLQPLARPDVLTLHICRYDDQYAYFLYDRIEDFEVFEVSDGFFPFTRKKLDEFIGLLKHFGEQLTAPPAEGIVMFRPIQETELAGWHIRPQSAWYKERPSFYCQVYDPLETNESLHYATIFHFDLGMNENFGFWLYSFPRDALQDPAYQPIDHGVGRINLDQRGIDQFIALLNQWQLHAERAFFELINRP